MQPLKPILWHQGLFLQPQHFQYLENYFSSLTHLLFKYRENEFWGVVKLQINETSLNEFIFDILNGEFVFRGGEWISFPGNAHLKRRSFEEEWTDPDKPFYVFLGLKKIAQDEKNVFLWEEGTEVSSELSVRFIAKKNPEEVQDQLDPNAPVGHLKKMEYLLKILWESEVQGIADYDIIPLAKLIREGNNIKLAEDYVPPCLTIASSQVLLGLFKTVRDQLTSRCKQLEEFKNPGEVEKIDIDSQYLTYLLALRSLNRYVPVIYSLFEQSKTTSPRDAYTLLSQIIGELSTFSQRINALTETEKGVRLLPHYNHEDPFSCFNEANRLIWELLNEIVIGPEHIIKLNKEDLYWIAELPADSLDLRNDFYLALHTSLDKNSVLESVSQLVKLCSSQEVLTLVSRALPGIPLNYIEVPPPGLPKKMNSHYFRIARENKLWEYVERDRDIALVWEGCPEDLKVEVVVLKK
ncbi:type VI secretion system baseplate subunit TssK [Desulfonauticus submarinus]